MIGAARRFRELMSDLLLQREHSGGWSQAEESEFAVALERHWWEMSDDEQADAERQFAADRRIEAPAEIAFLDSPVAQGTSAPPRRAAA
jgi:hypothetical protein